MIQYLQQHYRPGKRSNLFMFLNTCSLSFSSHTKKIFLKGIQVPKDTRMTIYGFSIFYTQATFKMPIFSLTQFWQVAQSHNILTPKKHWTFKTNTVTLIFYKHFPQQWFPCSLWFYTWCQKLKSKTTITVTTWNIFTNIIFSHREWCTQQRMVTALLVCLQPSSSKSKKI